MRYEYTIPITFRVVLSIVEIRPLEVNGAWRDKRSSSAATKIKGIRAVYGNGPSVCCLVRTPSRLAAARRRGEDERDAPSPRKQPSQMRTMDGLGSRRVGRQAKLERRDETQGLPRCTRASGIRVRRLSCPHRRLAVHDSPVRHSEKRARMLFTHAWKANRQCYSLCDRCEAESVPARRTRSFPGRRRR